MNRRRFLKAASGLFLPAAPVMIIPKAMAQVGGLGFPGPGPGHSAGGGGSVTWAFKTNGTTGGGTSVTLTAMAIGTTVSSDIVVVLIGCDGAAPNSVSVGGNAATQAVADTSGVDQLSLWYVSGVTLGATSNVVVGSAGTMFTVGAEVGVISGSATPTPTATLQVAASFSDPFSASLTVPTGGIGIVGLCAGGSSGGAYTAATLDVAQNRGGGNTDQLSHTATGTGAAINVQYVTSGSQNHGLMAVWGP